ncbi:MAG TPA: hypothetical protein VK974_02605 [Methylophilaceae bacterium]|nr:hypothetical protein [Methylophilaceae bacterium]
MGKFNRALIQVIYGMLFSLCLLITIPAYAGAVLSNEKMESLGVNPANVIDQISGAFAMTSLQSAFASYNTRFFVLTNDTLYVIAPDERGIEMTLPLSRIQTVAVESGGLFGTGRDIELKTDLGVLILNFSIGRNVEADKFYGEITATGIKVAKFMGKRTNKMEGRYAIRTY